MSQAPPSPVPAKAPPVVTCGNGRVDASEACDDGNQIAGDGCSAKCRLEIIGYAGYYWVLSDHTLKSRVESVSEFNGRTALLYGKMGVLIEGTPQVVGPVRGPGVAVPEEFRGRVSAATPVSNTTACVVIDQKDVWCTHARPSQPTGSCGTSAKEGDEIYLADEMTRWCRKLSAEEPIVAMSERTVLVASGTVRRIERRRLTSDPPDMVTHTSRLVAIDDFFHRCALSEDGTVGCWGDGSFGQLGYMGKLDDSEMTDEEDLSWNTPPEKFLRFASPAEKIWVYEKESFALLQNGELWGWGDFAPMQLASTGETEGYLERMTLSGKPYGNDYKPPGASTLPSSPLELPPGCQVTNFDPNGLCAECAPGCWKCWGIHGVKPKDAQCVEP